VQCSLSSSFSPLYSALLCSALLCSAVLQSLEGVKAANMQNGFEHAVSQIIHPDPVDGHSYSVESSMKLSENRYRYNLYAKFTICNITADRTLLTLNSAIANSSYSNLFSAFVGSQYTVTGYFTLVKIVPTAQPSLRRTSNPSKQPSQRTRPIYLTVGDQCPNCQQCRLVDCFIVLRSLIYLNICVWRFYVKE
jgi:hypothetical protein